MKKHVLVAVLCLLAGFAVAQWMAGNEIRPLTTPAADTVPASLAARIDDLEFAIGEERRARQLLEDEVIYLSNRLGQAPQGPPVAAEATDREAIVAERRARIARRTSTGGRAERLAEAGFAEDRAAWIVRRESELQMEALQARYDAELSGDALAFREARRATAEALRNELGDAEYQQYLAANGRPTAVAVSSVMDSSPAQRAGLRPGDEILRYAGERIFNMADLNRATLGGEPGETVLVEVLRNGTTLQVPLPRGPVGILGGGRLRR